MIDGHLPSITLPKRIDRTHTLIDNIYARTNSIDDCAGILTNKIFDHQMIFLCRKVDIGKNKCKTYIGYGTFDTNKIDDQMQSLMSVNIIDRLDTSMNADPNINYSILLKSIIDAKDKYIPK